MTSLWLRLRVWFKDSETILWARLQMLVGVVWTVLSVTDLVPIFASFGWEKYVAVALMIQGMITEAARRAREPHDLGIKTVADLDTIALPIKVDDKVVVNEVAGTITVKTSEIPPEVMAKAIGV